MQALSGAFREPPIGCEGGSAHGLLPPFRIIGQSPTAAPVTEQAKVKTLPRLRFKPGGTAKAPFVPAHAPLVGHGWEREAFFHT